MISVIMSTFNGSKTITDAINSILGQKYTNFEFIICDDASTDETQQILAKFAKMDPRIRVICNSQNQGLPRSLNRCIELANGEYVARMDDDDISLANRFSKQVLFLQTHQNISFVGSSILIFDQDQIYGTQKYPEYPSVLDLFRGNQFAHPAMLIRKSALQRIGNYSENENVYRIEDYDLWMRMYAAGFTGANLLNPVLKFRENPSSFKRRSIRSRINIVKLLCRSKRYFNVGIRGTVMILVSLLKTFIPSFVYKFIHNYKYRNKEAKK